MHTESQWRYRAQRLGLRLVRYNQALGYEQYGPYGLVERATGRIVGVRLAAKDIERILFGDDTENPQDPVLAGQSPATAHGD